MIAYRQLPITPDERLQLALQGYTKVVDIRFKPQEAEKAEAVAEQVEEVKPEPVKRTRRAKAQVSN